MAREKGSINGAVANEAFRIALFLVYYIALICLGIAVLVGAIFVADFLATDYLPRIENGRAAIGVIGAIAGVLLLAGVFGLYLIKPLFSFTKSTNEERVEVHENDCPRLFQLIKQLSKRTGFSMPRHVYLTTDVNACVFYNIGFWSIFLPVRKNLEIGLGIFNATTVQEVKAILAHEFGHFGQSSMKVGSAVSVTNRVLYNLIYTDDFIDRMLFSWRNAGWVVWKLFGMLAYGMTALVKRITMYVFLFVERGNRKLSRLMEFGADEVACRCVGSDAFISAMCKIDLLAACDASQLRPFLENALAERKMPDNYFKAHDVVAEMSRKIGWPSMEVGVPLTEPYDFGVVESRIKVNDVWSTHPELSDRLEHARELSLECESEEMQSAWTLVPCETAQKVSDRFFELCVARREIKPDKISESEFREFVEKSYAENGFPVEFEPFFERVPEKFDLKMAFETEVMQNPFTEEYKRLIGTLNTAKSDMATLDRIISGEIEVKKFLYDGIEYTREGAPVDRHKEYLDKLVAEVAGKDSAACSYLVHYGAVSDHLHIRKLYEDMEKIADLHSKVSERLATHDEYLARSFSNGDSLTEAEYRGLCVRIVAMEKDVQAGIKALFRDVPDAIPDGKVRQFMIEYTTKLHNNELEYGQQSFQELQELREMLGSMCNGYHRKCRLSIARFAASLASQ